MPKHECIAACTKGWSPSRRCHCSLCGRNFTVVTHFDKHLIQGAQLTCADPASVGLELNDRGIWQAPGEVDIRERFKS